MINKAHDQPTWFTSEQELIALQRGLLHKLPLREMELEWDLRLWGRDGWTVWIGRCDLL